MIQLRVGNYTVDVEVIPKDENGLVSVVVWVSDGYRHLLTAKALTGESPIAWEVSTDE